MGLGLGGFVDGSVLHQILQWHHMISDTDGNLVSTVEGLRLVLGALLVTAGASLHRSARSRPHAAPQPPAR